MSDGILLGPAALIKAIAPQYISTNISGDPSAPGYYVKDKYCTCHGKFYKCLGTTYGTFDPTKWVETTVDANFGTGEDFTGATASTAGTHGYVPAPAAGDQNKVLNGAGQWEESPGTKRYPVTITVTGSGAYDHTFDYTDATGIDVVTEDMIVDRIEIGNPDAFDAKQRFTCGNGTIRLRCDSVNGTSTVVCLVQKAATDPETITSTEFDILNNRMLVLENVESNTAITIHPADWTLDNGVYKYTWTNSKISTKTAVDVQFLAGAEDADTDTIFVEKVTGAVELTTEWLPDEDIPVNIKVTYARASDIANMTGEDIATDMVTGAVNVDEALEIIDQRGVYSATEETIIGRWIDGKPIYRKVLKHSSPVSLSNSAWASFPGLTNALNVDQFLYARALGMQNNYGNSFPVAIARDVYKILSVRHEGTIEVTALILEYTKLSDTATITT